MANRNPDNPLLRAVNEALKKKPKGLRSLKEVASRFNVPYGRFYSWLSRNKVPPESFAPIAKALGLPSKMEALKKKYNTESLKERSVAKGPLSDKAQYPSLTDAIEDFDDRIRRTLQIHGYETDARVLIQSMQENDIMFITAADSVLYESTDGGRDRLGPAIRVAVSEMAYLVYARPSIHGLEQQLNYRKEDAIHKHDGFQYELKKIREEACRPVSPKDKKLPVKAKQILLLEVDSCRFWMPETVVIAFFQSDDPGRCVNVYVRLAVEPEVGQVMLKMGPDFCASFKKFA